VSVARRGVGCVRFCSLPPRSRTPRRFHCQPDGVVANAPAEQEDQERLRVRPRFTSTRYGTPGYCQLSLDCASEITTGADDESEMGVFHHLHQPQRWATLRARLNEYVPTAADVGIIFVN